MLLFRSDPISSLCVCVCVFFLLSLFSLCLIDHADLICCAFLHVLEMVFGCDNLRLPYIFCKWCAFWWCTWFGAFIYSLWFRFANHYPITVLGKAVGLIRTLLLLPFRYLSLEAALRVALQCGFTAHAHIATSRLICHLLFLFQIVQMFCCIVLADLYRVIEASLYRK